MDNSKSSTFVMMAASASEQMFPYVIYKPIYLYLTWTESGLTGVHRIGPKVDDLIYSGLKISYAKLRCPTWKI